MIKITTEKNLMAAAYFPLSNALLAISAKETIKVVTIIDKPLFS